MLPSHTDEPTVPQARRMARVLWFGLLLGQVVFAGVLITMTRRGQLPQVQGMYPLLFYISLGALIVLTPLAYFIRNQIYKANWERHAVTPRGYVMGNVILLAILEMVAIVALVATMVIGELMPTIIVAGVALGVQVINFPTGAPMRPRAPGAPGADDGADSGGDGDGSAQGGETSDRAES